MSGHSVSDLHQRVADLARRTVRNNLWRQRQCFNLIPSETSPSLLMKLCEIADPAGRYAEHRTLKGKEVYYYQGTDFIREIEEEAQREMRTFFDCREAEMRPISGQMANEVVFKALLRFWAKRHDVKGPRRLKLVLNNDLTKGGHLSAQPMGALFNYVSYDAERGGDSVLNFPLCDDNPYRTDVQKLGDLLERHRPELVVLGKSMFLYPEPVREVAEMVQGMDPKPIIHYDMAHVLGLYGAFQTPLQEGADVVTGSTHKTFFGPQRGVVLSNLVKEHRDRKLWLEIKGRAFPGSTSNHHLGTLVGLLLAAYEMNAFKDEYQQAVIRNARSFARALADAGLQVEGDPDDGYTHTHQVVLRVREHGTGEEIARRLEDNNIVTNYQALPDDSSFVESSGIRLGVQEMTRFGLGEGDFAMLAGFMAVIIKQNKDVAVHVARERRRFMNMQYCLPPDDALPIAAQLLASILPGSDYAKSFADALVSATAALDE
jgi:glycine/serine hydroxymethyltransferase